MPLGLEGIFQNVAKIKLKGGVVGKVSVVLIVVSLAMAGIAWSVREPVISVVAIILVFVLAFSMLWRLINFADKNPQAALMEGAELLAHAQIALGMKSEPSLPITADDREQPTPTALAPTDPAVQRPDPPELGPAGHVE